MFIVIDFYFPVVTDVNLTRVNIKVKLSCEIEEEV
jgi:hypothetical protein